MEAEPVEGNCQSKEGRWRVAMRGLDDVVPGVMGRLHASVPGRGVSGLARKVVPHERTHARVITPSGFPDLG